MADLKAFSSGLKPRLSTDTKIVGSEETPARWDDVCAPAPSVIVYPRTEEDVAETVKYCREQGLKCLAESGGHSWSIKNSGDVKVLISLRELNTVTVAEDLQSVTLQGGTLIGELIAAAAAKKVDVTTGVCNGVGALGSLLHGGIGRYIGSHGLGIDNLLSVNLVDATGKLHKNVTESTHAELWWALCGAGTSLGIVTQATIKAHPQLNDGMSWAGVMFFVGDSKLEKLLKLVNETKLETNMGLQFLFVCPPPLNFQPSILVAPWYYGPEEEAKKTWKPLLDLEPDVIQMDMLPPEKLNDFQEPFCDKSGRKPGLGMGLETFDIDAYKEIWNLYVKFVTENPEAGRSVVLAEAYPKAKAMSRPREATLFANRDIRFECVCVPWYENASFDIKANAFSASVREIWLQKCGHPDGRKRVYPAFAGVNEPLEHLYGEPERLEKLRAIKAKWDPENHWSALGV
ncbi:hypothetical protein TWF696_008069 [Orbilia brochopaga]|uniref:FAD-binding PCMH-type domain-containing protein n=1 Tax=Orbilia brochopaga TaxID=3140254 RepID=A0AAV9UQS8_9PEZI